MTTITDETAPIATTTPVSVSTVDGITLAVRRWAADTAKAVVVLVHGFAASTDDAALVRQAEALQAVGYDVVSYDSRGHGESEGLCTLGDLEAHDVAAAVEIARRPGLPLIVVGASMGAIAVLRYAARGPGREDLAGVVAISCPAAWRAPRSAQGILAAAMTQTSVGRWLARHHLRVRLSSKWTDPEPPTTLIEHIKVPVALVHGDSDRFIRPADARELFRSAPEPRRLDMVPGMGHAYHLAAVAPVVSAVEWVRAHVDHPAV